MSGRGNVRGICPGNMSMKKCPDPPPLTRAQQLHRVINLCMRIMQRETNQIKSNQIYLLKKKKKKQQDTKAGKPALTWAQQKGTIKQ